MRLETLYFISGVFLILATILGSIECHEKDKEPGAADKLKGTNKNNFLYRENTIAKLRTNKFARLFNKVIGFTPKLKENNPLELYTLVLYDADLIKMAAYKTLIYLFKKSKTDEEKKELIIPIIHSATELVKYYSVVLNCPKIKLTFYEGLSYTRKCFKYYPDEKDGTCFKYKALLLESFFFSHKVEINRIMRKWLVNTYKKAIALMPKDKMLAFLAAKLGCEFKLQTENKNFFMRKIKELYMGPVVENYNCKQELLAIKGGVKDLGTYEGEYYYLLAKALVNEGFYNEAIVALINARNGPVVDAKTRHTNKKVQEYLEKIYLIQHGDL
ncbi:Hypothetical protein CINCED_3A010195 [Cinara cedri]|uniref:Tetratricopeptide-like helical domain n=1 Tax=Cinara cedri TaxID=506608 RepID=A0A5E4M1I0_9HEMI|nr:Hypothetical protein CINCED_3A010195 [Cinara cedri]